MGRKDIRQNEKDVLHVDGFMGCLLTGMQLRCPACQKGAMYSGRQQHETCPNCGWAFHQKGDGDWLVTWLFAYTLAAVIMLVSMVIMHFFTSLDLVAEVVLCGIIGALSVALLFRNCKGMAAGVLYFLRIHWQE